MRLYINNQKAKREMKLTTVMTTFTGVIQSGMGRGANFIAMPIYHDIFSKLLNEDPFPGTLNLKLVGDPIEVINVAFENGKVFDDLEVDGKSFGGIITIPVRILGYEREIIAVGVRPLLTTHTSEIIEIVSGDHIRSTLRVKDGQTVEFEIVD